MSEQSTDEMDELQKAIISNMIMLGGEGDGEFIAKVMFEKDFNPDPARLAQITMNYITMSTVQMGHYNQLLLSKEFQISELSALTTKACRRLDKLSDLEGQLILKRLTEILSGDEDA